VLPTNGTLTVTKAPLSVTADNKSRLYGQANPTLTGAISGIKNGDNITATYTTLAVPASPVGGYAITPNLSDPGGKLGNYTVTVNNGTLTVNPAPLSVTADNKNRLYGQSNPVFTGTISGIQNGDNITATYSSTATPASPVGTYAIVPSLNDPDGKIFNYTVTITNGTLTVGKASLTVNVDNKTKVLNAPNPTLTGSITGIQNGDNITATYQTTATQTSPVGSYPITATLNDPGNKLSNYAVTNNPGTLTITYAPSGTCYGDLGHAVLQPVNPDSSSVFKKGSTVPVKFRVCDANGVSIGTAGVVITPGAPVFVSSTAGVGAVDETVYSTTPDTAFRWDPTNQQWIFNQNTSNLVSGVKYTYKIQLNDGTSITYVFGIK